MGRTINAQAQRHRQIPRNGSKWVEHNLQDDAFLNAEVTCSLPKNLAGEEVLFLANICTNSRFSGVALIIARPKNPALTQHDWNWDNPTFTDDWEIVGGKIIAYKHCKIAQGCDCVFSLLRKHLKHKGYSNYGWECRYDDNNDVVGLLLKNYL